VVGGGMAALRLIEEIAAVCPGRFETVLVGKEPHPPYNRVLLSSLLAGDAERADIELRPAEWLADTGASSSAAMPPSSCGRRNAR
jgi:nitrite reductase (NADH) large subunit